MQSHLQEISKQVPFLRTLKKKQQLGAICLTLCLEEPFTLSGMHVEYWPGCKIKQHTAQGKKTKNFPDLLLKKEKKNEQVNEWQMSADNVLME